MRVLVERISARVEVFEIMVIGVGIVENGLDCEWINLWHN